MDEKENLPRTDTEYHIPVWRLDDEDLKNLRRILDNIQSGSAGAELWHLVTVNDLVISAQTEWYHRIDLQNGR